MSIVVVGQFILQNAGLIAGGVAGSMVLGVSMLLWLHHRAKRRKLTRQRLASCWLATLSELSISLDGMQEMTRRLIRNRQHPGPSGSVYKSDMLLHRWLSEGFVDLARKCGYDCKDLVKSMQKDLTLFNWNINQASNTRLRGRGVMLASQINRDKLQKLVNVYDSAAIRLTCNRHKRMVGLWSQSAESLSDFCFEHELVTGGVAESPSGIPRAWQMDEAKAWLIKDLAEVGEDEW